MKKIGLIFLLGICTTVFGQQIPQYSQYLRNQFMANPGAAGIYDFTDVTLSGRSQWTSFDSKAIAPMTTYLSVTAPLSKNKVKYDPGLRTGSGLVRNPEIHTGKLKHAIGGQMLADQYGAFRKLQFAGTYAIHLPITKSINMSFGAKVGLSNNTFNQERAKVLNPTLDQTYVDYTKTNGSRNILDLGAGLYFYSKRFFIGIAADQLTKESVAFGSGSANFDPQMYLNSIAGIKLNVNENLTISPSVLVKFMNPAPISIEGTLQLEYKEALWMAFSYRNNDAIIGMLGMNINKKIKFGYSFDYSISTFNRYTIGGHELILGIMLGRN